MSYMQYNPVKLTGLVILRRNCFLKRVVEGLIEGKSRSDGKTKKKT